MKILQNKSLKLEYTTDMSESKNKIDHPIVLILIMITMFASVIFGIKFIVDFCSKAQFEQAERLKKQQVECFENPIRVGVMPDGRVINKIVYPNQSGSDTIYFYTNPDGSIDSTINYNNDKMRRNNPQFQPAK